MNRVESPWTFRLGIAPPLGWGAGGWNAAGLGQRDVSEAPGHKEAHRYNTYILRYVYV